MRVDLPGKAKELSFMYRRVVSLFLIYLNMCAFGFI